jgi:hypothetical protein
MNINFYIARKKLMLNWYSHAVSPYVGELSSFSQCIRPLYVLYGNDSEQYVSLTKVRTTTGVSIKITQKNSTLEMFAFMFCNKYLFWILPPVFQRKFVRRCMVAVHGSPSSPGGFLRFYRYSF